MGNENKYIRCKRCNRLLKTEKAQSIGYGPKCYRKMQEERIDPKNDLFNTKFTVDIKYV